VAVDLHGIAERLFVGVMAPLVLGGPLQPGHAIGARASLALGPEQDRRPANDRAPADPNLADRVERARIARIRLLAPVDRADPPSAAEWALSAALHDLLQAANPMFDAPLRRSSAARILALAAAAIDAVPAPASVRDALSRHSWFARVLEVARTDTTVSWWLGSRTFLGEDPPARLRAWPELRRVRVNATRRTLLELSPLAFDAEPFADAVARFLSQTPLTDVATCTRSTPAFAWADSALALVATRAGRTLALRALARLPTAEVHSALGRAVRELFVHRRASVSGPALAILAERAIAEARGHLSAATEGAATSTRPDATFARALGALVATEQLRSQPGWLERDRRGLLSSLDPLVRSEAAREGLALLQTHLTSRGGTVRA